MCRWSVWLSSPCSVSCGGGRLTKRRIKESKQKLGDNCEDLEELEEPCNTHRCPGTYIINQ